MKMTDGLFHRVFTEIAAQYPDIAPPMPRWSTSAPRIRPIAQPEAASAIHNAWLRTIEYRSLGHLPPG
jgi:isocitrate/isopropylmalate dehydrogenase